MWQLEGVEIYVIFINDGYLKFRFKSASNFLQSTSDLLFNMFSIRFIIENSLFDSTI